MKILVVNDDGIDAEGLAVLARWASTLGEVTISAPATQQSGKSHAIAIGRSFAVRKVSLGLGESAAYAVDSTPVDCVRFATLGLNKTYDLVLSGVNRGFNLGEDLLYSGTVGAVFEAALRGISAISFSTDPTTFAYAEKALAEVWKYFEEHHLLQKNGIYNVNIPPCYKGILQTRQGGAYFSDHWIDNGDGSWQQKGYCVHDNKHDVSIDTDATIDGYVTVTPLTIDRTAR